METTTTFAAILIPLAFAMISLNFYLVVIKVDKSVMKGALEII